MISALVDFGRRPAPPPPPQLNFSLSQSIGLVSPTEIPGSAASLGYEWISVNQNSHCIQGGHSLAKMKFPVFSLSFPCVTKIFPVLFLSKN